jgi:hypothetical protein
MMQVILGVLVAACVLAFGGAAGAAEPLPFVGTEHVDDDLAAWVHELAENAAVLAREDGARRARLDPNRGPETEIARMDLLEGGSGLAFAGGIIAIALLVGRRRRVANRRRATALTHTRRRLGQTFTIDSRSSFDANVCS